jgi:hypothetical protein
MRVHDAAIGDIYVDENGKLWRCIATCKEPTVLEMMGKLGMPMIFIGISMVLVQFSNALIQDSDPWRGAGVGYFAGVFEGAAVVMLFGRLIAWWREHQRSRAAMLAAARFASTATDTETDLEAVKQASASTSRG